VTLHDGQHVGPRVTFTVVRRHRVALVVFSGSEKPVYVPVDAMVMA